MLENITPDLIFNAGVVICAAAAVCAVSAVIILRIAKARLDKRLDAEYGKRRRRSK